MNYVFALEFKKIAEENKPPLKDRAKHVAKMVIPTMLGMSTGALAASQLDTYLNKYQSQTAKNITKGLLTIGTPIAINLLIPSIREEWQKNLTRIKNK